MTFVKFLKNDGEIFAYFPNELNGNDFRMSYAHVGQHSDCHVDYANESIPATKEEYNDLLQELISIGYNDLKVLN